MKHDPLAVLWKGAGLAVVNKPHGMVVHQPHGGPDLVAAAAQALGWPLVHACHRLDAAAAGALLVSKPGKAAAAGTALFAQRNVLKLYAAITQGIPAWDHTKVDVALRQQGSRTHTVPNGGTMGPDVREAHTQVWTVARGRGAALVLARTATGRFHQVRAHLGWLGLPIVGDRTYGAAPAPVLCLHAVRLAFRHPMTGALVDVAAPFHGGWLRLLGRHAFDGAAAGQLTAAAASHGLPEDE